jgi:hypothetical protein
MSRHELRSRELTSSTAPLFALFVGAFSVGMAEFVIAGILPQDRGSGQPSRYAIRVRSVGAGPAECGEMPLNADKNRCACPGDVNRFIARSRCLVG